mmetsp:Transcript_70817/g.160198  ORF Transcript_70817/g.160198 Transcript_70817/m.160198 type:complete len:210 (+) Transcript_70817:637-1266(+)
MADMATAVVTFTFFPSRLLNMGAMACFADEVDADHSRSMSSPNWSCISYLSFFLPLAVLMKRSVAATASPCSASPTRYRSRADRASAASSSARPRASYNARRASCLYQRSSKAYELWSIAVTAAASASAASCAAISSGVTAAAAASASLFARAALSPSRASWRSRFLRSSSDRAAFFRASSSSAILFRSRALFFKIFLIDSQESFFEES